MKYIISLIIFLSFAAQASLWAQAENEGEKIPTQKISLQARFIDGAVELRWYPESAALWRLAIRKGYILERMELSENSEEDRWQQMTGNPIKPLEMKDWEKLDMEDTYIYIAAHAIHEPQKIPTRDALLKKWMDYRNEETAVFSFFLLATNMNKKAAQAAGVGFVDTSVESGKSYAYQIRVNEDKTLMDEDVDLILIDTKIPYKHPMPLGTRIEEGDGLIKLYWDAKVNRKAFCTYHVERSTDNRNFERITVLPLFLGSIEANENLYIDTVDNYQKYYYRVIGATRFGDEGKPSPVVEGMGRDLSPPMGATNIEVEGNRKTINIKWDLPFASKDLKGFYIGRSAETEGPFHYLNERPLSPSIRSFEDNNPQIFEPYYVVVAIDTAGNTSHGFSVLASIEDHDPPAQPLGLTGKVDTNGIVTFQWDRNTEEDLLGYHIYMANGKNDVYQQLTRHPIRLTSFSDTVTMKALNKKIYYKITALDYNNNPSPYSEILVVKRPDIIPPAAPSIYKYEVGDEKVDLVWHNSSSDDIKQHRLLREKEGESTPVELLSYRKGAQTAFTDTTVEMGASYIYTLSAEDEAGNVTMSSPLTLSVYDHGRRPEVENLQVQFDKTEQTAHLTWTYGRTSGQFRFVVFKGSEDQPLSSYKSTAGDQMEYRDFIRHKGAYQYAVKVIYADGGESELSQPVRLEVSK